MPGRKPKVYIPTFKSPFDWSEEDYQHIKNIKSLSDIKKIEIDRWDSEDNLPCVDLTINGFPIAFNCISFRDAAAIDDIGCGKKPTAEFLAILEDQLQFYEYLQKDKASGSKKK